ncbi:MAG: hypothetical protein M3072_00120 [Candidatus Dormibacteraeota bacterium]|nr:hypothetical protein [Candidatus Dormibacteraeota bacterium]
MIRRLDSRTGFALLLICCGAGLAALELAPTPVRGSAWQFGWALSFLLGAALLVGAALANRRRGWLWLPVGCLVSLGVGSAAVAATGLVQFWAYGWPLVVPGGLGLGLWLHGLAGRRPRERGWGLGLAKVGLLLFLILVALFEGVMHWSGHYQGLASTAVLAAIVLLLGIWLLVRRWVPARQY